MRYVRTLPVVPRGAALPVPRGVLGELSPDTKRVLVTGTVISLIALTFARLFHSLALR